MTLGKTLDGMMVLSFIVIFLFLGGTLTLGTLIALLIKWLSNV